MMKRLTTPGLLTLTALIVALSADLLAAAEPNGARIVGTITDHHNQSPLPYVQVYIQSLNRGDVTDNTGLYEIGDLPPGRYDLTVRLQGYRAHHFSDIVLASNQTIRLNVALTPAAIEMANVTVTATRSESDPAQVPQLVSIVSPREIRQRNSRQTPELLREEVGVVIQKTNQGGGSPILRGLKANKLLLMVDGIRLNNATYRGGNTQYLNTVDASTLERIEVVHGPVSALYGSDALGGVVNVISGSPSFAPDSEFRFKANAAATISSADHTKSSHAAVALANDRIAFLMNGSVQSFGDIRRGGNGGEELMRRLRNDPRTDRILNKTQSPNGYNAYDLSGKASLRLSSLQRLTLATQHNRQVDVPRYDVVEALKDSIRMFDPQERDLVYLRYTDHKPRRLFDLFRATVSAHRQFERRIRHKFGSLTESREQFRTWTLGAQAQMDKDLGTHHLVYGLELYRDQVATRSSRLNTATGLSERTAPRFPDGSTFLSFGAYAEDAYRILPALRLTGGLRFSTFRLRAPFESDPSSDSAFGQVVQNSSALTGSLGLQYHVTRTVSAVATVAQGFRTPNLDDVTKLGPGKGLSFYDVPNPEVVPEKSVSFDAGFKVSGPGLRANLIGYYNRLTDLLVRRPATFRGSSTILDGGDTLAVFRKENAGHAYIAGFAASLEVGLSEQLSLIGNITFSYGQNTSQNEPLSGIPPASGLVGVRWRSGLVWTEINSRFAFEQTRLSGEDALDLRIPDGGTPGWITANFRTGVDVTRNLSLDFSLSNIFDQNYREHFSGFNAPGRNFMLAGRFSY